MPSSAEKKWEAGGLARYCVEHREVSWAALVAVLIWGWFSYGKLAQQEDPRIPHRAALLVTRFPGATALQIEQLVTRPLEKKVAELESIDEIKSQSRSGVSVITVSLLFGGAQKIEQEWDKLRARLREVTLPHGCEAPHLDTDFGNTITLLFAVTSPPASEAECQARARLIRGRLQAARGQTSATNRAAVLAFYPPAVAESYRDLVKERFVQFLDARKIGREPVTVQGKSFVMADFATTAQRAEIEVFVQEFIRRMAGTDGELHPDFGQPIILMGDEDPLPQIRATAMPRYSYRELEVIGERLEDELKQVGSVGRVRKIGTVPETVYLLFSLPNIVGNNLTSIQVMDSISSRNQIIPGGVLRTEGQNFPVQLSGEFTDETELLGAVVGLTEEGRGMPIYLRDVFEVRRGYENPISFSVDVLKRAGKRQELTELRSVLVAVEMKEESIIGQFNQEVQAAIEQLKKRLPEGVEIVSVSDQPTAVSHRIRHFVQCFLEAVCIVIFMALLLMDGRSALVVAAAIPLTVALTLGGLGLLKIPLHQISIAALIIALGMLVDDPVVASDGINRELAHGQPGGIAAWLGPYKLRRPILFGTLINIVAFLPLILLPGDKGAFILALPMVVTLALVSSRIVSMTFVPLLGYYLLRGQKGLEAGGEVRSFFLFKPIDHALVALLPRYQRLLQLALEHPGRTIVIAYGLLVLSFGLTPFFGTQFFPPAERNQFLIDVELPESASIVQTRQRCQDIVQVLKQYEAIESAAVFAGGSAPRFYYNVTPREPGSYLAQVLVNTRRAEDVPALLARLRAELDHAIAGARIIVKQLEQGPPVDAPIQIRLTGPDLDVLRPLADQVARALRRAGGYHVHDDLGRRMPTLEINIDQERANTLNIDNSKIGRVTQAAFSGLKVTELREGDRLIPVVIRLRVEERNEAEKIRSLYVESLRNQPIPLDSFASVAIKPEFATIAHYNQLRTVTVQGYSVVGGLPSAVLERARQALHHVALPSGYKLELAGEARELKKSQAEMGGVMKISLSLIALSLVLQFNSVVKALVVMLTVPLGLVGAFIGIAVMQTALGFMALLGLVSLAGVIVSHIIVLSDFIEEARARGMELKEALVQAGLVRLRAVLVTVLATVGGLVPLALTGGELWRPLTAVHIFGLLFATFLTLVLLPALYFVFSARLKWIR
ncbi:MAG: efflux RND transporter permease subunit [Chloroflexi bacterium]|nr:efflux RND transporter permease subunit [Chloroflexota bacterium]